MAAKKKRKLKKGFFVFYNSYIDKKKRFFLHMTPERTLVYKLGDAPVFVMEPSTHSKVQLEQQFHTMTLDAFALLRASETCSPDILVSSLGAGVSLSEFCILWTQMRSKQIKQNHIKHAQKQKSS